MTYEDFITEVWARVYDCPPIWRRGQAVFNVIDKYWGVARDVQFIDGVDCFYNDSCIQEFIDHAWVLIKSRYDN